MNEEFLRFCLRMCIFCCTFEHLPWLAHFSSHSSKANSLVATAAHAAHTQFARNTNKKIGFALLYCLYPYYREQAPIAG